MNFKKNFKRFFTMSRSAEGFTLVELIVVIAILGILVGVGMPAYGSYVESANKGVDRNNLAIVNNAFAIACIEHGVDPATGVSAAELAWNGKTVTGLSSVTLVTKSSASTTNQDIITSFAANLGSGVEFKMHTSSDITFSNGKFVSSKLGAEGGNGGSEGEGESARPTLPAGGQQTVQYQGKDITVNNEDINNLKYSTFIDKIGEQALMEQVDDITGIAAGMANSDIMGNILGSDGFKSAAMSALGLDNEKDLNASLNTLAMKYMQANPGTDLNTALAQVKANAAVLYAAQQTGGMQVSDVKTLLSNENGNNPTNVIAGNLTSQDGSGTGLSQAALAYGMYTAFANSGAPGSEKITNTQPSAVLNDLNNADFQAYLKTPQGEADMAAYLSAMNVVNSNTQNTDVVKDLMVNGYANTDLVGAITEAMGKVQ